MQPECIKVINTESLFGLRPTYLFSADGLFDGTVAAMQDFIPFCPYGCRLLTVT